MSKPIAVNRKARYDYQILETLEGGLVLTGDEIKSIRAGRANLTSSYVRILGSEAWAININLPGAEDPIRTKKVLLHREEIKKLIGKTAEKGLTLVPLSLYTKRGRAKIDIGLGKGKKEYGKKETKKLQDIERELRQSLKKNQYK